MLVSVLTNSGQRLEKWQTLLENTGRLTNKLQTPGRKVTGCLKARSNSWGTSLGNSEVPVYIGKFRKPLACSGQDTCSEKSIEDTKLSSKDDPGAQGKPAQVLKEYSSTEPICKDWKRNLFWCLCVRFFFFAFFPLGFLFCFFFFSWHLKKSLSKHWLNTSYKNRDCSDHTPQGIVFAKIVWKSI